MKKFFFTFFVLIILAAMALFFGWAQLGVPPDAYGLIQSKSHGTDTLLVKPGEFRWVWYKLIPTNVTTAIFRLNPVYREFSANNTLPSGKIYAAFAGIDDSFAWHIRAAFSYCLRPDALIQLVTVNNINTQEELSRYEDGLAGRIETYILRRLSVADEISRQIIEDLLTSGDSPDLTREIYEQFPLTDQFSLMIKSAEFPDFAFYQLTKSLYEDYIVLQKEYITVNLREQAKSRIEFFRRFDELEQYGVILTKYPILMEYLALENK